MPGNLFSLYLPFFQRSVTQFKRCSCYEIGEDVFSLAELECCVIRGNTSRPSHIKPPFADAPKTSRPYRMYGISATDFRINFILVRTTSCFFFIVYLFICLFIADLTFGRFPHHRIMVTCLIHLGCPSTSSKLWTNKWI